MARNNQIVRILSVARALAASRRGVSLKALAEREGWNWRTVYRDKDALQSAGFPIEEVDRCRFRLPNDWAAPNLPGIESDEILAFFAVRALAESWRATAVGRPLDRLWAKLTAARGGQGTFLPAREPWLSVRSPIAVDYRAHDKTIATFDKAAREYIVVTCRYRALSTRQISARQIEPGELYWDPGLESLYIIGWCRLRQDVRVFAAHRFVAAALSEERFVPKAAAHSRAALKHAFRVWRGDNIQTVKVRFSPEVADEISERIWRPGQGIAKQPGGSVVLTLQVAGLNEIQRWIMGYGAAAEVLAPAELRNAVRAAAAAVTAREGGSGAGVAIARKGDERGR